MGMLSSICRALLLLPPCACATSSPAAGASTAKASAIGARRRAVPCEGVDIGSDGGGKLVARCWGEDGASEFMVKVAVRDAIINEDETRKICRQFRAGLFARV